jgi:transcriptional regulator with XRE-family HTH domain
MNIGNLIRAKRKAKGKTLVEIGDALRISDKTVWELEKQNRGTMAGLQRICDFLGLEWVGLASGRTLGARIWAERLKRGWTQEIVANKAGISRPGVIPLGWRYHPGIPGRHYRVLDGRHPRNPQHGICNPI